MAKRAQSQEPFTGLTLHALIPDPHNRRKHTPRNVDMIAAALRSVGASRSIVIDEKNEVLAGNGVVEAAAQAGISKLQIVDVDGDTIVAVRRRGLTDEQKRSLAIFDNRTAELAEWDVGQLRADAEAGLDFKPFFFPDEQRDLLGTGERPGRTEPDDAPAERPTTIARGDLFALGDHVLLCGDSSNQAEVARVLRGDDVDLVLTDPPYCSGGFQETGKSGKASGSVGTRSDEMIHNDTLSSRGYVALLKAVISNTNARAAYVFTDWRMWLNLFDVMESSGYGVRNMIVWDKQTPGMGQGWRMQHELIMAGITSRAPHFDPHVAHGNVIQASRTGNMLHPTQKPVDLITKILSVSNWARVIADPFAGAGSTLIAAQGLGLSCRAVELSPGFCQVIIDRWEAFSGGEAIKIAAA